QSVPGGIGSRLTRGRPFQPNCGRAAVDVSRLVSLARTVVSRSRIQERVVMGNLLSEKAGPRLEKGTASLARPPSAPGLDGVPCRSLAAAGVVPVFNAKSGVKYRHDLFELFQEGERGVSAQASAVTRTQVLAGWDVHRIQNQRRRGACRP